MRGPSSNALYSAALQDHISSKYSLKQNNSPSLKSIKTHGISPLSKRQQQLVRWSKSIKKTKNNVKEPEFRDKYLDYKPHSLAERLGVSDYKCLTNLTRIYIGVLPHDHISMEEWKEIKRKAFHSFEKNSRHSKIEKKLECPICQEGYAHTTQILLSCGHLYHESCFRSWERLQPSRSCCLCRQPYQRLQTRDAHVLALYHAATTIQTCWRGYIQRKRFEPVWVNHVPLDFKIRKKRLMQKMEHGQIKSTFGCPGRRKTSSADQNSKIEIDEKNKNSKIEIDEKNKNSKIEIDEKNKLPQINSHNNQLSQQSSIVTLFDNLELVNQHSMRIVDDSISHLTSKPKRKGLSTFWRNVVRSIKKRGKQDCSICLCPMDQLLQVTADGQVIGGTTKSLAVLGCSHYLHTTCFTSFQSLMNGRHCPCCRQEITKIKYF